MFRIYTLFAKIASKLYRLDRKLDHYENIYTTCITPTYTTSSSLSGVTVSSSAVRLIGNDLNIAMTLALTSAAQTTIGTGNVTNRELCTIDIPNFIYIGSPTSNDNDNLNRISAYGDRGAMSSGYSTGNACPTSLDYVTSISAYDSGTQLGTLHIAIMINANYAKTSQLKFSGDIPVIRVGSYYD